MKGTTEKKIEKTVNKKIANVSTFKKPAQAWKNDYGKVLSPLPKDELKKWVETHHAALFA